MTNATWMPLEKKNLSPEASILHPRLLQASVPYAPIPSLLKNA